MLCVSKEVRLYIWENTPRFADGELNGKTEWNFVAQIFWSYLALIFRSQIVKNLSSNFYRTILLAFGRILPLISGESWENIIGRRNFQSLRANHSNDWRMLFQNMEEYKFCYTQITILTPTGLILTWRDIEENLLSLKLQCRNYWAETTPDAELNQLTVFNEESFNASYREKMLL